MTAPAPKPTIAYQGNSGIMMCPECHGATLGYHGAGTCACMQVNRVYVDDFSCNCCGLPIRNLKKKKARGEK